MKKLSQSNRIATILKKNPNQRFTCKEMATELLNEYPEYYFEKEKNPKFTTRNLFLNQISAEIVSQKIQILNKDSKIIWDNTTFPHQIYYSI